MNVMRLSLGVLFGVLSAAITSAETRPIGSEWLWDELSEGQRARVISGEQVAAKLRVSGSDWPNCVAYQWVDAKPIEAAAVFADYELQHTYIPKVLESRISRVLSPDHLFVDYKVDVGFLGMTSTYTVENHARWIPSRDEYWLKWDRVTASHASVIDGLVRVQPHDGGALFFYQLYSVIPSGPISGFVKERGFESLKASVHAVIGQIKREKRDGKEQLERQVERLKAAVAH